MKVNVCLPFVAVLSIGLVYGVVIDADYADGPVLPLPAKDQYVINATHTRLGRHGKTILCMVQTAEFQTEKNESFDLKKHFNGSMCTHAMFAYAFLCKVADLCFPDEIPKYISTSTRGTSFQNIQELKKAWPDLRVGVSIGGYHEGSQQFSNITTDLWSRYRFIKNVITKLKLVNATAIELAWYAPTIRFAGSPKDRENYVELISEFRNTLIQERLDWHLGVAIKIMYGSIDYYDIAAISPLVDWIRLETHGFHSHWEDSAGFNAPLYGRKGDRKTVANWIRYVASLADAKRMLLEVPFYGRPWTLSEEPVPGGPGSASIGLFTEKATIPYFKICEMVRADNSSWEEKWDPYSLTPWAINERHYFSYDDERSVAAKVGFARSQNLAGVSVSNIAMDDFDGKCGRGKMPLLQAVAASIATSKSA